MTIMQNMLDLCDAFSTGLDIRFNTTKSVAMRIASRYGADCAHLCSTMSKLIYPGCLPAGISELITIDPRG